MASLRYFHAPPRWRRSQSDGLAAPHANCDFTYPYFTILHASTLRFYWNRPLPSHRHGVNNLVRRRGDTEADPRRGLESQSRLAGFPVYSKNKTTPRACHTLRQIVQLIPRRLIDRTANAHGNAPLKVINSIIAPLGYQTPPTAYQNSPFGRRIRRASNTPRDARRTPQETRVDYPRRRASITLGDARRLP